MSEQRDPIASDLSLLRGLTRERMSRRLLLQRAGMGVGALGLAPLIAACGGVAGTGEESSADEDAVAAFWADKEKNGKFVFASWPLYIDVDPNNQNRHPSLERFTKQTGIEVDYKEVIQSPTSFLGKIEPLLAAGEPTGYDLMIIENGQYLDRLKRGGWLAPLDHSQLPNFEAHAHPKYKDPPFDPGNAFTVPWQSGFTGIAYNRKACGREITSFEDLLDPKFKGKVGMLADNQQLLCFAMLGLGIEPETSTPDDWEAAAEVLRKQKSDGLVRKYYELDYIEALARGDIWLSMGWSGDVFQVTQSGAKDLEFVLPDEGGLIWTDNLCIPKDAANPVDAITYMNYCYEPRAAAMLAAGINYITPVPDARPFIERDAERASGKRREALEYIANSNLVFPTDAEYEKAHRVRELDPEELKEWNRIVQPIYQS